MTPTLAGRIQTRIALMLLIGLPVGFCFGRALGNVPATLSLLGLSLGIGLLLDPLYNYLQHSSWDNDWPTLFMVVAGYVEGSALWLLLQISATWHIKALDAFYVMTATLFLPMYGTIWLLMFVANLGILNIFSPYRRFKGGKFWG